MKSYKNKTMKRKTMKRKTMKGKISGGGGAFSKQTNKTIQGKPVVLTPKKTKRVTFKNSPEKFSPDDISPEDIYHNKFNKRSTTDVLTDIAKEEGITHKTHIKEFVDNGIQKLRKKTRNIKKTNSATLVSLHNRENSKEAILAKMIAEYKR
jgi:hypothetical protein